MTGKRGKGRPPMAEAELLERARQAQRMVDMELEAMAAGGRRPLRKQALDRVCAQLHIKPRTLQRLLAMLESYGPDVAAEELIDFLEDSLNAPLNKEWRQMIRQGLPARRR
jgi:hypothetical protein